MEASMHKSYRFPRFTLSLRKLIRVLSPADWYVTTAASGLYVVEKHGEHGWRPEGVFLSLRDAFDFGELLHGPVPRAAAGFVALLARLERSSLSIDLPHQS